MAQTSTRRHGTSARKIYIYIYVYMALYCGSARSLQIESMVDLLVLFQAKSTTCSVLGTGRAIVGKVVSAKAVVIGGRRCSRCV